ncbi:putative zinc finger CCHC domain-containing protein [Glycine max]|nr:putative zinc finger CCHC domain-containing protein [Glycine max]
MEGEEGGGIRLSKRIANGEVDYKTKSGTAWSHSYLNQKPWHPLSYPNQRRKWIAEQTHANRQRRTEEVSREFAQEQEFFRQTALISKKEKEKVELMQAVSFMYVRPPGYNAESAKAAEMNDEKKKEDMSKGLSADEGPSSSMPPQSSSHLNEEKKKPRPKDVFGRPLPTEEEFEVLKNAPRYVDWCYFVCLWCQEMNVLCGIQKLSNDVLFFNFGWIACNRMVFRLETGAPARVKPFGIEVRNVKCLRCGNYGHQSGDRECPLKDAIMPNEESRLKRDDPLNAILAHTDPTEPLKWELKQRPGISPPRGGFKPDDPNQQIVAEDDIFDEYGGFLSMDNIPELLTNFSKKPKKSKKSKHKKQLQLNSDSEASSDDGERRSKKKKVKVNKKKRDRARSSSSETSVSVEGHGKSRHKSSHSSEDSDSYWNDRSRTKRERSFSSKGSDHSRHGRSKHNRRKHVYSSEDSDSQRDDQSRKNIQKHKSKDSKKRHSYSYENSSPARDHADNKSRDALSYSSDDSNHQRQPKVKRSSLKHSSTAHCDSQKHDRNYGFDRYQGDQSRAVSEDSDVHKDDLNRRMKQKYRHTPKGSEHPESDMDKQNRKKQCYSLKDSSAADGYHRSEKSRYYEHSYSSDYSDHREKHHKSRRSSYKY